MHWTRSTGRVGSEFQLSDQIRTPDILMRHWHLALHGQVTNFELRLTCIKQNKDAALHHMCIYCKVCLRVCDYGSGCKLELKTASKPSQTRVQAWDHCTRHVLPRGPDRDERMATAESQAQAGQRTKC